MKKIMILIITCVILSGCSLIPRLTFATKNTVPQSINKQKSKDVCKGEAKFNEQGEIISCSKGYQSSNQGYVKEERRMTIVEKVKSFINSLMGWGFWGLVLLVILVPGLAGTILGRLLEGTIGITGKALRSITRGVQKARKRGVDLNIALDSELDEDVKKYVKKIKQQEKIK